MAVADVFTAITEDRPYRDGMSYDKAKNVLNNMAESNELDDNMVGIILDNFKEFNSARDKSQKKVKKYFEKFNKTTHNLQKQTQSIR